MGRLLLGNIEPGTTDEEVREFLQKYGFPAYDEIEHAPGDGSRPAVIVTFKGIDPAVLMNLQVRVHDMYWKRRKINAQIMRDQFS